MIYTVSICRSITFTRQLHKMVRLSKNPPANSRWIVWCLFVFEHFVGLAPKGLPLRFWWKKVYVSLYTISTWSKRGLINDLQIVSGATIVTACAWRCLTVSLFTFQFHLFFHYLHHMTDFYQVSYLNTFKTETAQHVFQWRLL